jgi:hypothetical protein
MEKETPRTPLFRWLPGAVFLLAVVLAPGPAAADLTVDTIDSNSPYMMSGDLRVSARGIIL